MTVSDCLQVLGQVGCCEARMSTKHMGLNTKVRASFALSTLHCVFMTALHCIAQVLHSSSGRQQHMLALMFVQCCMQSLSIQLLALALALGRLLERSCLLSLGAFGWAGDVGPSYNTVPFARPQCQLRLRAAPFLRRHHRLCLLWLPPPQAVLSPNFQSEPLMPSLAEPSMFGRK